MRGMAGRMGGLLAFFRQAQETGAPPSGWALALDAAVAAGAAGVAVIEVARRVRVFTVVVPSSKAMLLGGSQATLGGMLFRHPVSVHTPVTACVAAALTALPLATRRLYPIGSWLTIAAAIVVVHPAAVPPVALGTVLYAAYSTIVYSRYRNLAIATVAVATVAIAIALGGELPRFPSQLTAIVAITPAALAGFGIRELRRRLADSTARLRRAGAEAEAATRRALAAERARIASELHDVVTHNVSVMIVQAGAARTVLASSPGDAQAALLAVEATGRAAMAELRNLLGLLSPPVDGSDGAISDAPAPVAPRLVTASPLTASPLTAGPVAAGPVAAGPLAASAATTASARGGISPGTVSPRTASPGTVSPGTASLHPQPGLSDLNALIGRVSAAGLPVSLRVSGDPRPLSAGADLAAYRVVQEALTNVLRHAGRAAASVTVQWGADLQITVSDDGQGTGQPSAGSRDRAPASRGVTGRGIAGCGVAGRGLLGLRERLSLYGGQLDAGPRPGEGGWQVRAVLPA